jgi:hypothetical protein
LAPDLAEDLQPNFLIETVSKQQSVNLGALFGKQYRGLELILDSVRVLSIKKVIGELEPQKLTLVHIKCNQGVMVELALV